MPVVTIEWIAGRSREQKQAIAARVTDALCADGDVAPGDVWVVFRDVEAGDWAVAGRLVDGR